MKTNYTTEEISEIVQGQVDARRTSHREMGKWQSAWAGDIWPSTKNEDLHIKGKEQITTPAPQNAVTLAMRLIDSKPKIRVPTLGDNVEKDRSASKRERWLNTMWENVASEQDADPIVGATWQSFVLGRHVMQPVWVEDKLPVSLRGTRLPFTVRTLDPRNAGTYHNGYYTEYGWNKYDAPYHDVAVRYGLKGKQNGKSYDGEEEVCVIDYWWQCDTGVYNAVLMEDEFIKKPTKTDYLMVPIIEGYGDYAPLSEHEYKSLSLIAPMMDAWLYECRLTSQMATGLLYYFWPFLIATNDQGQPIEDIYMEPGLIKAMPPGTRIDTITGNPNIQLADRLGATMQQYMQQSTFPEVLHGKAPGDVQAGFGIDILAQSARGRINQFRKNLERTIRQVNMVILNMLEWPNVDPDGITVYGYSPQVQRGRYYTLSAEDTDGEYRTIVDLKVDMDGNNLQRQTLWARFVEQGLISRRTFLETILTDEVPEDELTRVAMEQALFSDELKPVTSLRALIDTYPENPDDPEADSEPGSWMDIIKGTPYEQIARQQGLLSEPELVPQPPADGGMEAILPEMPMEAPMPPGGPAVNGPTPPDMMPPGVEPGLQADMSLSPALTVMDQGGLTPEMMGLPADFPPDMWDQLMAEDPETLQMIINRMQGG